MVPEWFIVSFLGMCCVVAVDIIRRAYVQVKKFEEEIETAKAMRRLRTTAQPHVTVLIYGNDGIKLQRTLQSLQKIRYSSYDVVIVGENIPLDTIRQLKTPRYRFGLKTVRRRAISPLHQAYQAAYRKSQKGKMLVLLQAGDSLDPMALKRAVVLQKQKNTWWVEDRTEYTNESGIRGIAMELQNILRLQSYPLRRIGTATALRHPLSIRSSQRLPIIEVIVAIALAMGILSVGIIALWYGWLLFTGYILALVWIRGPKEGVERLTLSFSAVSALFFMPVASFLQVISQLSTRK